MFKPEVALKRVQHLLKNYTRTFITSGTKHGGKIYDKFNPLENEKIPIGKYMINYIKRGTGPHAIFCFPGILGAMSSHIPHLLDHLDLQKYTVYSWDQPGYSYSQPPSRRTNDFSLESDALYAAEFMDKMDCNHYSVLGWSGGATSAIIMAAKYPERIRKLLVWGGIAFVDRNAAENFLWFSDTTKWGGTMKLVLEKEHGSECFSEHFRYWMEEFASQFEKSNGEIIPKALLHKVSAPCLVIHGEKDNLVLPDQAHYLHKHLKNSDLLVWKDARHNVHLRYPDEFLRLAEEFLDK